MIIVKTGDKHPIEWRANMDLTGATVRLIARKGAGEPADLPVDITDAPQGTVTHHLAGDLAAGKYYIELEVTTGGGDVITFPNDRYASLLVVDDLD